MFQTQLYLKGPLKEDPPATAFPGRLKRLRTELHRHNVTAAVIFDPINVRRKRVRARKMWWLQQSWAVKKGKLKHFVEPGPYFFVK